MLTIRCVKKKWGCINLRLIKTHKKISIVIFENRFLKFISFFYVGQFLLTYFLSSKGDSYVTASDEMPVRIQAKVIVFSRSIVLMLFSCN